MARPEQEIIASREKAQKVLEMIRKPSMFAKHILAIDLFDYNAKYVDDDNRFIVYRAGSKVGKTLSTAVKSIHFAMFPTLYNAEVKNVRHAEVLIVAPTQWQANIMLDTIKNLIQRSNLLKQFIKRENREMIEMIWLSGKGTTKIFTRAAGEHGESLRGYRPNVLIADEAAFIRDEVFVAVVPRIGAQQGSVWLVSTPFGKRGYFYRACESAWKGERWKEFHVKSYENPLIASDKDFLAEVKLVTKDQYTQEIEGEFIEEADALIPMALITNAIRDYRIPADARYYIGVDVARYGKDSTVFSVIAKDDNDNVYLVECVERAKGTITDTANEMFALYERYKPDVIFVDETGLGAGVVDIAKTYDLPVRGIIFSLQTKAEMYKNLRLLFENGRIKIRNVEKMVYQLSYLKREYSVSGHMRVTSEEHDDYPDSLALACMAVQVGDDWDVYERSVDDLFL